jgi:hypothetical protein
MNLLTYQFYFRVQCKLNLQTDRFNLRRVLTDKLTTDQFGVFRNMWKWTFKHTNSNSKHIIDADVDTDELTTDQFIETYSKGIDELTTDQFMSAGKKGYKWTYYRSVHECGLKMIQVNLLQISSQIQIQCKLNLLIDRLNLHGM